MGIPFRCGLIHSWLLGVFGSTSVAGVGGTGQAMNYYRSALLKPSRHQHQELARRATATLPFLSALPYLASDSCTSS